MAGVDHDTLAGWLTRLRLTAIRDQLDNLLDEAAAKKLTLRESLALLVEREIARKDERRMMAALVKAHGTGRLEDRLVFHARPSCSSSTNPATCRSRRTPRTCSSSSSRSATSAGAS